MMTESFSSTSSAVSGPLIRVPKERVSDSALRTDTSSPVSDLYLRKYCPRDFIG